MYNVKQLKQIEIGLEEGRDMDWVTPEYSADEIEYIRQSGLLIEFAKNVKRETPNSNLKHEV